MFGVDIRYDAVERLEMDKRAVALIRLDHEMFASSDPGVPFKRSHLAAKDSGRVEAGPV